MDIQRFYAGKFLLALGILPPILFFHPDRAVADCYEWIGVDGQFSRIESYPPPNNHPTPGEPSLAAYHSHTKCTLVNGQKQFDFTCSNNSESYEWYDDPSTREDDPVAGCSVHGLRMPRATVETAD